MFKVSKRTLLFVAGLVWLAAGVNIARLGFLSVGQVDPVFIGHCHRHHRCVHAVPHEHLLEDGGQAL